MNQSFTFGNKNKTIPYTISESKNRKYLNIAVEEGQVSIVIPKGMVKSIYEPVLHKKAP